MDARFCLTRPLLAEQPRSAMHARIDAAGWSFRPCFAAKYSASQPDADLWPARALFAAFYIVAPSLGNRRPPLTVVR